MKIAVIDDEADLREVIREALQLQGYEIVEADDGTTGLELIRSEHPDLIICDIKMPKMSGDELFDRLKEDDSDLSIIPFIFLSANANEQEQLKRLNRGADDCFEKPIELPRLVAHVNSHLANVKRISHFFKRKLDRIVASLPHAIQSDFNSYRSLSSDAADYVEAIANSLQTLSQRIVDQGSSKTSTATSCLDSFANGVGSENFSQLEYLQICLDEFEKRHSLARAINGEELSWTLIFMVAKSQLEEKKIFVSDLYVSAPSAKSTVNARINSLIEDDVFEKISDAHDGRRQQILLTERFKTALLGHIDNSIGLIRDTLI